MARLKYKQEGFYGQLKSAFRGAGIVNRGWGGGAVLSVTVTLQIKIGPKRELLVQLSALYPHEKTKTKKKLRN